MSSPYGTILPRRFQVKAGHVLRTARRIPVELLFPPVCCGCARRTGSEGVLCAQCWQALRFIERPWCERLGIPFSRELGEGALSAGAIADPPVFDRARSAVAYEGVAIGLVRTLKFHDRTELAPWMTRWMLRVGRELADEADIVVPVPLHRRRFLWRRFNQSAELARAFASLSGSRFEPAVVVRTRVTRQQVGLDITERQTNVRGAFKVPEEAEIVVRGRRVLVIDDVYTTGATVSAVAMALKRAGAVSVDVLTFARVLAQDFSM